MSVPRLQGPWAHTSSKRCAAALLGHSLPTGRRSFLREMGRINRVPPGLNPQQTLSQLTGKHVAFLKCLALLVRRSLIFCWSCLPFHAAFAPSQQQRKCKAARGLQPELLPKPHGFQVGSGENPFSFKVLSRLWFRTDTPGTHGHLRVLPCPVSACRHSAGSAGPGHSAHRTLGRTQALPLEDGVAAAQQSWAQNSSPARD